jgi:hypothetical protein
MPTTLSYTSQQLTSIFVHVVVDKSIYVSIFFYHRAAKLALE